MLGWTQNEIGQAVGVTQGRVAQKLSKISELKNLIKNRLDSGFPKKYKLFHWNKFKISQHPPSFRGCLGTI